MEINRNRMHEQIPRSATTTLPVGTNKEQRIDARWSCLSSTRALHCDDRRNLPAHSGSFNRSQCAGVDRAQDRYLAPKYALKLACTSRQQRHTGMSVRWKWCAGSQLCLHARAQMRVRGAECDVRVVDRWLTGG